MDGQELLTKLQSLNESDFTALCYNRIPFHTLPGEKDSQTQRAVAAIQYLEQNSQLREDFISALERLPTDTRDIITRWRDWEQEQRREIFQKWLYDRQPVVPSPIEDIWREFVRSLPWEVALTRRLDVLKASLSSANLQDTKTSEVLSDALGSRLELQALHEKARDLHNSLLRTIADRLKSVADSGQNEHINSSQKDISRALRSLNHFIDNCAFGRCLLLIGGIGSGKTHSIATRLSGDDIPPADGTMRPPDAGSDEGTFLLPLELPIRGEKIAQQIQDRLKLATRFDAISLRSVNVIRTHSGAAIQRVVIAIDGLDRWIDNQLAGELAQLIKTHSSNRAVYWLLTIQHNRYDAWVNSPLKSLLERMGFTPQASEHLLPDGFAKAEPTRRLREVWIGSWLSLDDLNRELKVGLRILETHPSPPSTDAVSPAKEYERIPSRKRPEIIQQPLFAWLIREEIWRAFPLANIQAYQTDLLARFWERRKAALLGTDIAFDHLTRFTQSTADTFIRERGATEIPYPEDLSHNDTLALYALERMGLLRINRATDIESGDNLTTIVLLVEAHWQFRAALRMRDANKIEGADYEQISQWLRANVFPMKVRPPSLDGTLLLSLLLLGRVQQKFDDLWRLYSLALSERGGPRSAPWFAGPQSHPVIQSRLVAEKVTKADAADPHILFAQLFFLVGAGNEIPVEMRLLPLRDHMPSIEARDLSGYFLHLVERHLHTVAGKEKFFECLDHLFDAGALGTCAAIMAKACDVLVMLAGSDLSAARYALEYANIRSGEISTHAISKKRTARRWLFCHLSRLLVDRLGPHMAFSLIQTAGWPSKWNHLRHGLFELRSEAQKAFGRWFRFGQNDKPLFVRWLIWIAERKSPQESNFALWAIIHGLRDVTEHKTPNRDIDPPIIRSLIENHPSAIHDKSWSNYLAPMLQIHYPELLSELDVRVTQRKA